MKPVAARSAARGQRGFSLLEALVALTIMGLALGAIYRLAGGSVASVQESDARSQALMLASSLLETRSAVAPGGFAERGQSGAGFDWQLYAEPYPTGRETLPGWPLFQVTALVTWTQGGSAREVRLATLLPERSALPGASAR